MKGVNEILNGSSREIMNRSVKQVQVLQVVTACYKSEWGIFVRTPGYKLITLRSFRGGAKTMHTKANTEF
jgi:hypothetical protein